MSIQLPDRVFNDLYTLDQGENDQFMTIFSRTIEYKLRSLTKFTAMRNFTHTMLRTVDLPLPVLYKLYEIQIVRYTFT